MPPARHPLTRRTALTLPPLAAVAAGCRWGPEEEPADEAAPGGEPPTTDDDSTYAAEAHAAVTAASGTVSAATGEFPALATALAGLAAAHEAHLALLADAVEDEATAPPVVPPTSSRAALADVRRAERRLQRRLADLADTVASGPFARALASMSAAVAQQLAELPAGPAGVDA